MMEKWNNRKTGGQKDRHMEYQKEIFTQNYLFKPHIIVHQRVLLGLTEWPLRLQIENSFSNISLLTAVPNSNYFQPIFLI